jgi:hypothetical protein
MVGPHRNYRNDDSMSLVRDAILAGSTNVWLREKAMRAPFVRRSVSRFMPGERIEDAIDAARELKIAGITTILTRLGENLEKASEADEVTEHYVGVMNRVKAAGLDAQISIKPTQLGLDFDEALCRRHLFALLDKSDALGNFLWIDMESTPYVDRTLALFRAARGRGASASRSRPTSIDPPRTSTSSPGSAQRSVSSRARTRNRRTSPIQRRPTSTRTISDSWCGCCSRTRSRPAVSST